MERVARVLLAAGLGVVLARPVPAGEPPDTLLWSKLQERLAAIERGVDGVLGLSVKDLTSGASIEIHPDLVLATASSIKVVVLYELYRQADEGRLDLHEVVRPGGQRAAGAGVLQHLSDRVALTWRDLAVLMMVLSDNEATNLLIDKVGMDRMTERVRGLGLAATHLRRKMMDLDAARRGDENVATASELRRMMEIVHQGTGLSRPRADDMLALAAMPKDAPFRTPLPATLRVVDKPGSLEGIRAAAAIVDLPGRPYAVAVLTGQLRSEADGERAIRDISAALYETFERLSRSTAFGRLIPRR